ncbi:uncharacterized protein LOC127737776 [Mytilus californianus]|uniref:uncharacterized protein LOC127737776 n=1 Tax=Mytilus californianus TaxID=6549 RepID=UPI0022451DC1|nr:uncharacterized protein LOC127737776 [Mytilus californianus]
MLSGPKDIHPFDTTVNKCLEVCNTNGYVYAGIQFVRCVCGKEDELDSSLKVEDSRCDKRCNDNSQSRCGGPLIMAVYHILGVNSTEKETVSSDEVGYSTETTELYTSSTKSYLEANYCSCPCKTTVSKWDILLNSNISKGKVLELIEKEVEQIQKEIAVDKKAISSYIRRKSSATDNRPTSVTVGILAVTIIVLVFMVFICIDCLSIYQKCTN